VRSRSERSRPVPTLPLRVAVHRRCGHRGHPTTSASCHLCILDHASPSWRASGLPRSDIPEATLTKEEQKCHGAIAKTLGQSHQHDREGTGRSASSRSTRTAALSGTRAPEPTPSPRSRRRSTRATYPSTCMRGPRRSQPRGFVCRGFDWNRGVRARSQRERRWDPAPQR
jgi:hypothetical protein